MLKRDPFILSSKKEAMKAVKLLTCPYIDRHQRMENEVILDYLRLSYYKTTVEECLQRVKLYNSLKSICEALKIDMHSDIINWDNLSEVEREGDAILCKWEDDNIMDYSGNDFYKDMLTIAKSFALVNFRRFPLDPIADDVLEAFT